MNNQRNSFVVTRFYSFLFLLFLVFSGCKPYSSGIKMADFSFIDLDDKPFSPQHLRAEKPTAMLFFNPTCEHCQDEADSLTRRAADLRNVNIVWVAVAGKAEMKTFDSTYHLTFNEMKIVRDTAKKAGKLFGVKDVPSILLFDAQRNLVAKYAGTLNASKILSELGQ